VACADGTLVITENGDSTIAVIVELDFLLKADARVFELFEKGRHRVGSIVCTENFGTKARHIIRQMLIELCGLDWLVVGSIW
jgi:O-acetyl-ADP-ribose deacetylase (regulator of RNase III)